ncbi:DUF4429 domain-containing protein [Streptomyces sp. NPDC002754]
MPVMHARGADCTLTFDGAYVEITRTRSFTRGQGDKRIPVSQITAVRWKDAGRIMGGFIGFTIAGHVASRAEHHRLGLATYDAVNDENAVVFPKKETAAFEAIRKAVDDAIAAHQTPTAPAAASGAGELAKYAELHTAGVLSDEEFATAKARILATL